MVSYDKKKVSILYTSWALTNLVIISLLALPMSRVQIVIAFLCVSAYGVHIVEEVLSRLTKNNSGGNK